MIAELMGSWMEYQGQRNTNQMASDMAENQMEFQRTQRSTGYQTSVADLRAAGLNPALAYSQGPASAMSGASPQLENPMGGFADSLSKGVGSALEYSRLKQDQRMQQSNIELNESSAALMSANAKQANTNAKLLQASLPAAEATAKMYEHGEGNVIPYLRLIKEIVR